MTTKEFSEEFEVLLQSYLANPVGGKLDVWAFDEYEKSVFLTNAQEEYVRSLYTGKNVLGDSFESTEDIAELLTPLQVTKDYNVPASKLTNPGDYENNASKLKSSDENSTTTGYVNTNKVLRAGGFKHTVFRLPDNLMYIFYEEAMIDPTYTDCCKAGLTILVQPIKHDEYYRRTRNPFRGPNSNRALRLNYGDNEVEIISSVPIGKYRVRFIRKPHPIILEQLIDNSIDGYQDEMSCELDTLSHRLILEIAVLAALASKRTSATALSGS